MPTYEYECKSCSHNFEVFQSMSDSPIKECPQCGKEVRRLIFGGTGVIFKGSGFYVTDKGKSSSSVSKKSEGAASSSAQASPCSQCSANSASGADGGKCPAASADTKQGSSGSEISRVSAGSDKSSGHESSSVKNKQESKSA